MTRPYVANTDLRYPNDPETWGDDGAPKKNVAKGGEVDEYAVKQSPWLLEQGKVSLKRSPGLVVTEKAKDKLAKPEAKP